MYRTYISAINYITIELTTWVEFLTLIAVFCLLVFYKQGYLFYCLNLLFQKALIFWKYNIFYFCISTLYFEKKIICFPNFLTLSLFKFLHVWTRRCILNFKNIFLKLPLIHKNQIINDHNEYRSQKYLKLL